MNYFTIVVRLIVVKNKKNNHTERLEIILNSLVDAGRATADLLLVVSGKLLHDPQDFHASLRTRLSGSTYHLELNAREQRKRAEYQYFQNALQYLKRSGFVTRDRGGLLTTWSLTSKGRIHLGQIKSRRMRYKKEKTGETFIVSYDIPEDMRNDRDWVREVLKLLDFSMVHKSVWVGSCKIPEDFMRDLKYREIFKYIHIFEVGKKGTLLRLQ